METRQTDRQGDSGLYQQQAGGIGTHPEIGRMSEAELAHVAENHVKAHREQPENQNLNRDVNPEFPDKQGQKKHGDKDQSEPPVSIIMGSHLFGVVFSL